MLCRTVNLLPNDCLGERMRWIRASPRRFCGRTYMITASGHSVGVLMGRPGKQTFPIYGLNGTLRAQWPCSLRALMSCFVSIFHMRSCRSALWRRGGWLGYVPRRGHSNISTGGTSMKVASQGVELDSFRRRSISGG